MYNWARLPTPPVMSYLPGSRPSWGHAEGGPNPNIINANVLFQLVVIRPSPFSLFFCLLAFLINQYGNNSVTKKNRHKRGQCCSTKTSEAKTHSLLGPNGHANGGTDNPAQTLSSAGVSLETSFDLVAGWRFEVIRRRKSAVRDVEPATGDVGATGLVTRSLQREAAWERSVYVNRGNKADNCRTPMVVKQMQFTSLGQT